MDKDISLCEAVFIARQPIFHPDEAVWGYELLFRSGEANFASILDEKQATSSVIADGLALAREGMDSSAKVLINFPENMLVEDAGFALPKDGCIIEILEDVQPSEAALGAVRRLKEAGYTLAVDDYSGQADLKPFIDLADIVKIDVLALDSDPERVAEVADSLPGGLTLLAEKVEDLDIFARLKGQGFDLFQGFFFSKPEIIPGKKLTSNELTKLQLLGELAKPRFRIRTAGGNSQGRPQPELPVIPLYQFRGGWGCGRRSRP